MAARGPGTTMGGAHLLILGAFSFSVVGIAVVLPGALLPVFFARLGLSLSDAGMFLAAQPLGHLVAVLAAPRVFPLVSAHRQIAGACLVLACALVGLGVSGSWTGALATMAATGIGIGVLEVGTNTVLLRESPTPNRTLNLTHLFFGVASIVTPLLATWATNRGVPWPWLWATAALCAAVTGTAWLLAASRPSKADSGVPRATVPARPRLSVVILAVAMGMYVGAEIGFGSWYTKYLTTTLGTSLPAAGSGLALYWAGLTTGRLALGVLAPGRSSARFIGGLSVAAGCMASVSLLAPSPAWFWVAGAGFGAALAGIFPGILALAGHWYPDALARSTGLLLAGAGAGQVVFPWVAAIAAEFVGLAPAMWVYPALCFGVALTVRLAATLQANGR